MRSCIIWRKTFELLLDSIGISEKDKIKSHLIEMFDKNFDSNKFENFCNEKI